LTELCNKVWNTETVPADWKDSVIVPLPKREIFQAAQNGEGLLYYRHLEKSWQALC